MSATMAMESGGALAVSHVTLGEHRGARRLWIEGRRLDRAGIRPGDSFAVTWSPFEGAVVIEFGEGDRRVSSRVRHGRTSPIVDVGCREVAEAFGADTRRVRLTVRRRRIVVEVHPDDLAARRREERLRDRLAEGRPLEVGSVCHGGGILDHALATGLAEAGVATRLAFAIEADEPTLDAAASNNPCWDGGTMMVGARLEEVEPADLPVVDVVTAGLPCTGASVQGRAKNGIASAEEHPDAGHLFVAFLAILRRCNPSVLVLENVELYARSLSAEMIRRTLALRGYEVVEGVVDGNALGALEMRRRWCLVATPPGLAPDLSALVPLREREARLGDIMEDVPPDDPSWMGTAHMDAKAERDRAKGSNFSVHHSDPDDARVRTMGGSYWRRQPTTPKIRHPTDPGRARLLTTTEHARAKTVPEGLVAGLSATLAHQILGNGVIHAAWRSVGVALARGLVPTSA